MAAAQKVIVLGASGNIGMPVLKALIAEGFEVTAVSRTSKAQIPSGVRLAVLDISNEQELEHHFRGQDAVVEAFGPSAAENQGRIVRAAVRAGIKHIITPEFAGDTFNPAAVELMIYEPKINAQKALEENSAGSNLQWTAIITGPWYDWAIVNNFFWLNKKQRAVTVFGSGNQKYSMCNTQTAVRALVDVLRRPQEFVNRPVYVADYTISTNELLPILEAISPGWEVKQVNIDNFFQTAKEKWQADRVAGVKETLGTEAYIMLGTYGLFEESNKYGADFSDKGEPAYVKNVGQLAAELKGLLST